MKKLIAVFMALLMCTACLWAAAEEPVTEEIPVLGITFTWPQMMLDATSGIVFGNAAQLDEGIYYDYLIFCAVTKEEFQQLLDQSPEILQEKATVLFYLFAVPEGKDFSAVTTLVGSSMPPEKALEIGKNGDWTYYLFKEDNEEYAASLNGVFADEFAAISAMDDELISAFSFSVPFNEYGEMDGRTVSFTATDLDGNAVSSAEIFAQHEITMVNIWATWCGPCVGELAELQAIHTRFLEKDCAVLGLLTDSDTESARSLIKQNGMTYQVVTAPDNFSSIFPYEAVPTSFFVDRNGAFLGTKIVGAQPDLYESALEPLLKK